MANYLNDPNEWTAIESGTNPPASWNGSQYEIVTAGNPDYGLRGGFNAEGTIAGTVTLLSANPWAGSELFFTIAINDPRAPGATIILDQPLVLNTPAEFSVTVDQFVDDYYILFSTNEGFSFYDIDAVIVPLADPAPSDETCDEPGQVTRCYVSIFDAPRIHESRLFQQGKRCLEANFNGALGVGRKIVSVKWSMQTPYSVVMDTARITADQRSTRVNITAAWTGDAWMRAQVTLDNGEIYTQLFHVVVPPSPWFGDVSPTAGPSELTASAP